MLAKILAGQPILRFGGFSLDSGKCLLFHLNETASAYNVCYEQTNCTGDYGGLRTRDLDTKGVSV